MRRMNYTTFFSYIRKLPFGGKLTEQQVEGVEAILAAFRAAGGKDVRHLAYILATAFHETGGRMVPVREGFAKTDAQARKITAKYKYGKPDPQTGHVYYGRGQVQLTWADNYKRVGKILDLPLYENPDLALDVHNGACILIEGMMRGASRKGDFTGKSVENYFNDAIDDAVGARAIVNGTDKAQLIATYHKAFRAALEAAMDADQFGELPADVKAKDAEPDRPNLLKDKTTWGGVTTFLGMGGLSFLDNINTGYALAAFAFGLVVVAGIFLFATGRLQIIRKGGV